MRVTLRQASRIDGERPQARTCRGDGRKHLPAIDVAKAGGWSGVETLQSVYQQADADTLLRVVLEASVVREVRCGT